MSAHCLLYYITDRNAFPGDESTRRRHLLEKIAEATRAGVDYIQLREKDLTTKKLEHLAGEAMNAIREARRLATVPWPLTPALLINSRTDVALAIEADGVHLRSDDISPQEVKKIWSCAAGSPFDKLRAGSARQAPLISISCHYPAEVTRAATDGATFAVFAPVFEKKDARPAGLELLHQACQAKIPVLALGGVTLSNARSCLEAGAAGIAGIRLFQENDIQMVVRAVHRARQ